MTPRPRIVVDNNVLISRLLLPAPVPAHAVRKAVDTGQLLVSEATLAELAEVLSRSKFDPYVTIADRQQFFRLLGGVAELVPVTYRVRACRDPKDNRILEVAVNGEANLIITGDQELLALNPFHAIVTVTPAAYLGL